MRTKLGNSVRSSSGIEKYVLDRIMYSIVHDKVSFDDEDRIAAIFDFFAIDRFRSQIRDELLND
jgi:hypothetical protein